MSTDDARKRFIPLENNPEVMTSLVHKLGLSDKLAFHDVYSIDDPDLLAFIPRPAHALLLVFPVTKTYESHRATEDADREVYQGSGPNEPVVWYKQTIRNACGLIGLLHGVSSGAVRDHITPDSDLSHLLQEAIPLQPPQRAELLYNSPSLEAAHRSAAQGGDTAAPSIDDEVDLHYVCFLKANDGHLWEMDGSRKGPLDRGALGPDEDVLSDTALSLGVRKFIERETAAGGGESRFSLIALAASMA